MTFAEAIESVQQGNVVRRKSLHSSNYICMWLGKQGVLRRDILGLAFFATPDAHVRIRFSCSCLPFQIEDLTSTEWSVVDARD